MGADRRSRYAKADTLSWHRMDGSQVELCELVGREKRTGVHSVTATEGDRLDLFAHRYYRDPLKFWKIADASAQMDPFDAVRINQPLLIPPDK